MKLTSIPEKLPKTLGIMTILPKQRINVNSSSLPPSCKKITVIVLVSTLFISTFFVFRHYHHARGHHLKKGKHHVGRPHHVGHGTGSDGKGDKIKQAIAANLDQIKARAGNIYVDNESEALNYPKKDDGRHHDDDHEDDDYDEDDDEYDDDDDDDDDYEDEKTHNEEAPK